MALNCRDRLAMGLLIASVLVQAAQPVSLLAPISVPIPVIDSLGHNVRLRSITTGKFTDNGKLSVAVLTTDGVISFFSWEGIAFHVGASISITGPDNLGSVVDVKSADINADGRQDLVVSYSPAVGVGPSSRILVFLSKGDGTFASPVETIGPFSNLLITDLNNDGKPDIISANSSAGSYVLLGRGDGTFQDPFVISVSAVLAADFNHDGNMDLLGDIQGAPGIFFGIAFGRGDGTFDAGHPVASPPVAPDNLIAGDFNGDGSPDLVFAASPVSDFRAATRLVNMAILLGNGDGTFQPPKLFSSAGGQLSAADLNGDGKLDLTCGYSVLLGNGDGTFLPPVFSATPAYVCGFGQGSLCGFRVTASLSADFNGDEMPDILTAYELLDPRGVLQPTTLVWAYANDSPGDGFLRPASSVATGSDTVGELSLVSGYGVNLARTTETAVGFPWPTALGGIRLHVGDALAQLLFVSPTQINYLLPQTTGTEISIERIGEPLVPKGIGFLGDIDAPGIFTLNGTRYAAASAVQIAVDGTQTPVSTYSCSNGGCTPVPIDATASPVYVSIYATGLSALPGPLGSVDIDGTFNCNGGAQVTYAGPQGQIPGLNQGNLLFPKNTHGIVSFSCTVSLVPGKGYIRTSNTVQLLFR